MQPQATGFMAQPQMMMSQPTGFQQQPNYGYGQVSEESSPWCRVTVTDLPPSRKQY